MTVMVDIIIIIEIFLVIQKPWKIALISSNYDNLFVLGDNNAEEIDPHMKSFC